MRLEDLKKTKDRRPFEAFDICLADGATVPVNHPDAVSWEGPDFAPVVYVVLPGGDWERINFAAITALTSRDARVR